MAEDVQVPKLGGVNKHAVLAVGGVAAAYLGYRYYQSRQAAATATADPTDPGYQDPGTIPSVDNGGSTGTVGGYGTYAPYGYDPNGNPITTPPTSSDYGFTGTTNAQWTQYAATQLEQSGTWSYTDVVSALGEFLANVPMSAVHIQITQAAIAVAGNPPTGSHTVIPAPAAPPAATVPAAKAPAHVHVTTATKTSFTVAWDGQPYAQYYVYVNGHQSQKLSGTLWDVNSSHAGMTIKAGSSYSVSVTAVNQAGKESAHSATITARTTK